METIKLDAEGTLLLEGYKLLEDGSAVDYIALWETESEQYLLERRGYLMVAEAYDFDYRGLVDELNDHLDSVSWCAFEILEILEDWEYVGCNCDRIRPLVDSYFRNLGEDENG